MVDHRTGEGVNRTLAIWAKWKKLGLYFLLTLPNGQKNGLSKSKTYNC